MAVTAESCMSPTPADALPILTEQQTKPLHDGEYIRMHVASVSGLTVLIRKKWEYPKATPYHNPQKQPPMIPHVSYSPKVPFSSTEVQSTKKSNTSPKPVL